MVIEIPNWVLWIIGVPFGLFALFCAVIGVMFIYGWNSRGGNWF